MSRDIGGRDGADKKVRLSNSARAQLFCHCFARTLRQNQRKSSGIAAMSGAEKVRHFVSEVPAPERADVSNDPPAVQIKLLTDCAARVGAGGCEPGEVNAARNQFNRAAAFIRV